MNVLTSQPAPRAALEPAPPSLSSSIEEALARIPPLWPLRHFVAVNPFAGLVDRPFAEACAHLERAVGRAPVLTPKDYLAEYRSGAIRPAHLESVSDSGWSVERLVRVLENAGEAEGGDPIATVADLLDQSRPHAHWSVFVTEEIAKWCAVAYDENQTTWNSPWKRLGLWAGWREAARWDRNPEAFGLPGFRAFVSGLPAAADDSIALCMDLLGRPAIPAADFLYRQLATISGWAGHVQYRVREDALRGRENRALHELLAIRLAYDAALYQAFADDGLFRAEWRHQSVPKRDPELRDALVRWQAAYELGYQSELVDSVRHSVATDRADRAPVQAVFCIDVRSEVFRRHLEAAMPGLQTIGFAGFFGFPVAHLGAGDPQLGSRCPVLLVPPVGSADSLTAPEKAACDQRRARAGAWKAFQHSAASCFSFVESAGIAFAAVLGGLRSRAHECHHPAAPRLVNVPLETRIDLAEGALRNMGLTRHFARLVLICGHGSRSANNPYASSLECGACGGHAGDVNARLAAITLNEPGVREGLVKRGIVIPDDTRFVAGLHQTVSDDVTLFDAGESASTHAGDLENLRAALARAGGASRLERAPAFGLQGVPAAELGEAFRARTRDISEVRPEWGLANNAALIAAPRSRTSGVRLAGRVFLHDYDAEADPDLKVLTLILSAPVVVASWINLQYYASRVDPVRYGSGDKALHHVIGGLGVAEGNGGDLKTGLPLQSLHDGAKFVHEPRRLTVVVEAECAAIETVLGAQPSVRQLFDHGWIHLIALQKEDAFRRMPGGRWQQLAASAEESK